MKILHIGGAGTIGKAVAAELGKRHDLITAGVNSGQHQVDIADIAQVRALFDTVGKVDAVVVTAGKIHLGPLAEITPEKFAIGLNSKLMGQVNVAQVAQQFLNDGGSITLTSGIVGEPEHQIRHGAAASMVNSAVEGYARGAAIELARGIRINVVSPTLLEESVAAIGAYFYGIEPAPASRVALGYSRSVEGAQTGQVYRVW
jgi:NAD(P)-dependent dehydrogenase (short-subunit alcohol dehydrogenase family)